MKIMIIPHNQSVIFTTDNGDYIKDITVDKDAIRVMLLKGREDLEWSEKRFIFNSEPASITYDGKSYSEPTTLRSRPDNMIDRFVILKPCEVTVYPH